MAGLESLVVEEKPAPGKPVDREKTCPLLLRVFYSTGRHNPPTEYTRGHVPQNELQIYTWKDATLQELASLVREVNPETRRKGTYFDFALVFPDFRGNGYRMREIGITCSGQKGTDDSKTLAQAKFTIGDYLDISITPPNRLPPPMRRPPMHNRGHF
uniref:Histone deacetylase complex subunit SAP18 n=1 Tax=Xenopsylla cheopis TaxID=163159 RepID=A0A6M2DPF2_XENCH